MLLEPSPALDTSPISTSSGVLIRLEEQSNVVYLYLFAWCDPPILLLGSCAPFSCNLACMPDDAIGDLLKTFRAMFVRNIAVELEAASSSDAELSSKTSESEVHREKVRRGSCLLLMRSCREIGFFSGACVRKMPFQYGEQKHGRYELTRQPEPSCAVTPCDDILLAFRYAEALLSDSSA